jgi:hypothetical protein
MPSAATHQPHQAPSLEITPKIYTDLKAQFEPLSPGMIDRMVEDGKYKIVDEQGSGQNHASNSSKKQ